MSISLEDLAARLAALEDKEAIRALKARYPVSYTHLTLPTICSV